MASRLIQNRQLSEDTWQVATDPTQAPAGANLLISLADWLAQPQAWLDHAGRAGVALQPTDDPVGLQPWLAQLALITVNFPAFTDGRGYSIARLLRERHGYAGQLRAVGDVFKDQLFYLSRVGFDAFLLREGEDAQDAISALDTFTEAYQVSVDRPEPLFRRRLG